ncbi:MAG: DUF1365 domain-containing protein [Hyphomicrobiaceae bacterium]|nr:DUF1365 domain-containing protein [Hyphomicrobiaceae bacterium]
MRAERTGRLGPPAPCVFAGQVVHKRLRPKPHAMAYDVFWLFLDLDRLDETSATLNLLSINRWNAVSFHERDHGDRDASTHKARPSLATHVRQTFATNGLAHAGHRVYLLSYPRVLGYTFNPIAVYFGYDDAGQLAGAIYEVNNTFGERHSYVTDISPDGQASHADGGALHAHGCTKKLYVSPFTEMAGRYSFRLTEPGETLTLGVMLRDADGALLKTHFTARALPLTDRTLARLSLTRPLMTAKVMAGIHYEAAKLWLKGVPLTAKPAGRRYSTSAISPAAPATMDAGPPRVSGHVPPFPTVPKRAYAQDRG